jgi:adenylate kinase family enzyme
VFPHSAASTGGDGAIDGVSATVSELNVNLKKLQIEEVTVEDRSADDQTIMARHSMRNSTVRRNDPDETIRNMSLVYQTELVSV